MPDQFDIQRTLDHAGEEEVNELMEKLADDKDENARLHRERAALQAKHHPENPLAPKNPAVDAK